MMSDGKLSKAEHVLKTADFRRCYKKGRVAKKNSIIFYCLPNGTDKTRIGFSISSRAVKKASSRNRTRRILREIYRLNKRDLRAGFDIVIVVKQEIAKTVPHKSIEDLFLNLAKNVKLLDIK